VSFHLKFIQNSRVGEWVVVVVGVNGFSIRCPGNIDRQPSPLHYHFIIFLLFLLLLILERERVEHFPNLMTKMRFSYIKNYFLIGRQKPELYSTNLGMRCKLHLVIKFKT
jgi:hypothetical protein